MCGIVGVWRPGGALDPADAARRVDAARAAVAHRGPDAAGSIVLPEHGLAFGHARLSILDLDSRANQPMASADASAVVTYNGEIYNFRELRKRLAKEHVGPFRTESDTEVLLEGYRAWGIDGILSAAVGMFAFALYDTRARTLHLARDRAGKKPLFYAQDGGGLAFASELQGLLRLLTRRPELDPAGLDAYLSLKFTPAPRTLLRGVSKLPPGTRLEMAAGGQPKVKPYWQPHAGAAGPATPARARELVAEALAASVRRRLVSDVPVCLFLSGGVDSSLIAAELAGQGVKGMKAYTVGYADLPSHNEFDYSRAVAAAFPLRYEEVVIDSRQALATLEESAGSLGEPISDWVWVPLHHLTRRAREEGFKVALLGEGSDELFIGYDVMLDGLTNIRRFETPVGRALALAGAGALAPVFRWAARGHRRYDLLRRAARGEPVYMGSSLGFPKSQRHHVAGPRLLAEGDPDAGGDFIESLEAAYRASARDPDDLVNRISFIEFYAKMGEVLLTRVDRVTMRGGLEARCPFLDQDLVELAFSIPGAWKVPGGKLKGLLLELAAKRLPPKVVNRKKMGFSFPFKEWLRAELGGFVDRSFKETRLFSDGWLNGAFFRDLLAEHRGGRVDHAPRIWAVFDLACWYDRWVA